MNEKRLYSAIKVCIFLLSLSNIAVFLKFIMTHRYLLASVTPHACRTATFILLSKFEHNFLLMLFLLLDCATIVCSELYTLVFDRVIHHGLTEMYSLTYVVSEFILNVFIVIHAFIFIKRTRRGHGILPMNELVNIY